MIQIYYHAARRLTASLALAAMMSVVPAAASGEHLADRLPKETRFYLTIPNAARTAAAWDASSLKRIWQDKAMLPFRQSCESQITRDDNLWMQAFRLKDIAAAADGSVTLAIVGESSDAILAISTSPAQRTNMQKLVSGWVTNWDRRLDAGQGDRREQSLLSGDPLIVYTFQTANQVRAIWERADMVILSNSQALIERMAAPANNGSLAAQQPFRHVWQESSSAPSFASRHAFYWLGDVMPLLVTPGFLGSREVVADTFAIAREQGFDAVQSSGGNLELNAHDLSLQIDSFVFRSKSLEKAARMMAMVEQPVLVEPRWVRSEATEYRQWNLDFERAIAGYGDWFDATYGDGQAGTFALVLDDIRDEPDSPQVDVRADLFRSLRSTMRSTRFPASHESESEDVIVYATEITRPERVAKALRGLLKDDPDVSPRVIDQVEVWEYGDLTQTEGPILGSDLSRWSIAVHDDHLLASNHIRGLELLIQGNLQATQWEAERLGEIAARLGYATICGWAVSRWPDVIRTNLEAIRTDNPDATAVGRIIARLTDRSPAASTRASMTEIEFGLLPDSNWFEQFSGSSGSFISQTSRGWHATYWLKVGQP